MPASISFSQLSTIGNPRSDAAKHARANAIAEISSRVHSGLLDYNDKAAVEREYKSVYTEEYYKYLSNLYYSLHQDQPSRVIYVPTENLANRKFPQYAKHTVVRFSKLNYFIHNRISQGCITIGRYNFPVDEDISMDTKEAFLTAWPGPLDAPAENLRGRLTNYIDTIWQHDQQRLIRYCIAANNEYRKTILKFLTGLLHRSGTIDAPDVTRLLLKPEEIEIKKEEKPLDTLQKHLLLGKRGEAIKFAKTKKLWDHAQCLSYLNKYQPPNAGAYNKDAAKLRDDSIVKLNHEYISSLEHGILSTVYRSLLNRILQSDPESIGTIKHQNVGNSNYEFAMLSANDCEMEFDPKNEMFKLIMAVKQAISNPAFANSHLISLGYASVDALDLSDDLSYRSHVSFKQGDTHASRTLTISNIDMLILNEIWEHCLNLVRGTCNPTNYDYIIDLVPYKLIFASRLLDYGMHSMFANYLNSIKIALIKARSQQLIERDDFYDWDAIEKSVEHLSRIWEIYLMCPHETLPQQAPSPDFSPTRLHYSESSYNAHADTRPMHLPSALVQSELQADYVDSMQPNSMIGQSFSFPFSPINDYDDLSRRESDVMDRRISNATNATNHTIGNDQNFAEIHNHSNNLQHVNQKPPLPLVAYPPPPPPQANKASTVHKHSSPESQSLQSNRDPIYNSPPPPPNFNPAQSLPSPPVLDQQVDYNDFPNQPNSMTGDSFNSPMSPANDYDDLLRRDSSDFNRRGSVATNNFTSNNTERQPQQQPGSSSSSGNNNANHNSSGKSQQPAGDQQSGFFTNLVGSAKALLPKSNSKQMILPDDSSKNIVYDEKRGVWRDTTEPERSGGNDMLDAPPQMTVSKPPSYSFADKFNKSSRYPKAQF